MAPRTNTNTTKLTLIQSWFHKTGVAHSIKDLEKALPSVASINGMQVKDYLQTLSDENKIRVEKIGSGNWYWSFPADEKKAKSESLDRAEEEYKQAVAVVQELKAKVEVAGEERADDEDMLLEAGGDRKSLLARHTDLIKDIEPLRKQLTAYSEQDPVEMDKKRQETLQFRAEAEQWTDQIESMEGWLKERMGGDREQLVMMKKTYYGEEYDEEEGCLREL